MNQKTDFKYFYGTEAETYSFYRIPKQLIIDAGQNVIILEKWVV